ncbi:MAG: hypothetical protein MI724_02095 [Spirochaetales bacterium]|nr:hypothetical protein [Spirochaetales bacterium]
MKATIRWIRCIGIGSISILILSCGNASIEGAWRHETHDLTVSSGSFEIRYHDPETVHAIRGGVVLEDAAVSFHLEGWYDGTTWAEFDSEETPLTETGRYRASDGRLIIRDSVGRTRRYRRVDSE